MLNKVILMGRLTRDPELRSTQSGTAVASFSLAVERDYKDKSTGERTTDFIDCVAWRNTAEFVSRYFTKGRMAVIQGSLQVRKYTDKEGNNRSATEVLIESVYFGDSKKDDSTTERPVQAPAYGQPSQPPAYGQPVPDFTELQDDEGGDLPF